MNVVSQIQTLCNKKGISIWQLAKELGISNGVIKKWEKTTSPKVTTLIKIADYFDVSLDYLVGRSDQQNNEVQDIETIIGNLLNKLENLRFNGNPIDSNMAETIENMLKSNLDIWAKIQ